MSIERGSPTQQRKSLEVANLFVRMGIGFVPVPVGNSEEYDKLTQEALAKLAAMEKTAEASESSPVGADKK